MARMVWLCVWALCCGAMASGALAGCKVEVSSARLDLVSPQPVAQLAELELFGAGFGEWSVYDNLVSVNGECADVLVWSETRIVAVVPAGVGVGVRNLEVRTASGQRIEASLNVVGPDRPRQPKLCASVGGPVTVDPDAPDTPDGDETFDIPDEADTSDVTDVEDAPDTPDVEDAPDTPDFPDTPPATPYFFVQLQDQGEVFEVTPGADIDAVVLRKRNGAVFYADDVIEYATPTESPFMDFPSALGPPDAYPTYPDTTMCLSTKGFVSLGGFGGYIIVRFADAIEPGDTLEVLEVGACFDDSGRWSEPEPYFVSISPTPDFNGFWLPLTFAQGPTSIVIPELP